MKIMVSACLLGQDCKYSGGNNLSEKVQDYVDGHKVIPICPEVLGGLPIPRVPCEIVEGVVTGKDGKSYDLEFRGGAQKALEIALKEQIDLAILQSRSPSCGVHQVYDGSFTGTLKEGQGCFAALLNEHGFKVMDLEDID